MIHPHKRDREAKREDVATIGVIGLTIALTPSRYEKARAGSPHQSRGAGPRKNDYIGGPHLGKNRALRVARSRRVRGTESAWVAGAVGEAEGSNVRRPGSGFVHGREVFLFPATI
jgi:hypothetical protein